MQNKTAGTDKWTHAASVIFCVISALFAVYVAFRYVLTLLLPILIGAGIGVSASALASKLSRHTRASKKTVSFAVLTTLLGSSVALLFFMIRRLTDELGKLAQSISSGQGGISEFFKTALEFTEKLGQSLSSIMPVGSDDPSDKINALVEKLFGNILSELGSAVPGVLSAILRALPEILLGVIVAIIVAFYFTLDSDRIISGIRALLPQRVRDTLSRIKKEAAFAAVGYIRSYSLIMLITFAEMFFGLSVLGVEYSFLIAAISAAVDILPVFGVGIVLLPWAIYSLMTRDLFLVIGLIILYVITVVVRQFIEPKIIGDHLGIHPLLTLASFYLAYRLFGFAGILLAPIILIVWRALRTSSDKEEITPP